MMFCAFPAAKKTTAGQECALMKKKDRPSVFQRLISSKQSPSNGESKKQVRFGSNKSYNIEPLRGAQNMWWTQSELARSRAESRSEHAAGTEAATYLHLYWESYLLFCPLDKIINPTTSPRPSMESLAYGFHLGFQGLERCSVVEAHRRKHRQRIVRSVLNAYRSHCKAERDSKMREASILRTSKMVLWAAAIGEAGQLAAATAYDESSLRSLCGMAE